MAQVKYLGSFPFCVTPTTNSSLVGANTYYPVGLTLADACYFFWKAKTFYFDYTYDTTTVKESLDYYSTDSGYGQTFVPTVETDFICYPNSPIWWYNQSVGSDIILFNQYSKINNTPTAYLYNNLYYFNLYIANTVGATIQSAGTQYNFPLILNGHTYNIPMYVDTSVFGIPNGSITVSNTWPYNP